MAAPVAEEEEEGVELEVELGAELEVELVLAWAAHSQEQYNIN